MKYSGEGKFWEVPGKSGGWNFLHRRRSDFSQKEPRAGSDGLLGGPSSELAEQVCRSAQGQIRDASPGTLKEDAS